MYLVTCVDDKNMLVPPPHPVELQLEIFCPLVAQKGTLAMGIICPECGPERKPAACQPELRV